MKKCKEWLFSETGMRVINVLFFLMMILQGGPVFGALAYGCWSLYLVGCIRRAKARWEKVVYGLLLIWAAVNLVLSLWLLVRALFPAA